MTICKECIAILGKFCTGFNLVEDSFNRFLLILRGFHALFIFHVKCTAILQILTMLLSITLYSFLNWFNFFYYLFIFLFFLILTIFNLHFLELASSYYHLSLELISLFSKALLNNSREVLILWRIKSSFLVDKNTLQTRTEKRNRLHF